MSKLAYLEGQLLKNVDVKSKGKAVSLHTMEELGGEV
jgi:hypothetical protein